MRRAQFSEADIEAVEEAGKQLFFNREKPTFSEALAELDAQSNPNPQVKLLVEFLRRRNIGKHGRYLESLRPKKQSAAPSTNGEAPTIQS